MEYILKNSQQVAIQWKKYKEPDGYGKASYDKEVDWRVYYASKAVEAFSTQGIERSLNHVFYLNEEQAALINFKDLLIFSGEEFTVGVHDLQKFFDFAGNIYMAVATL